MRVPAIVFRTVGDEAKDQVAVNAMMGHADDSMAAAYRERISDDRKLTRSGRHSRHLKQVADDVGVIGFGMSWATATSRRVARQIRAPHSIGNASSV